MLGGFELDFLEPALNHLVGLVAGFIKAFPQAVIRNATLVGLLPLLTQCAQVVLHLAPAQFVPRLPLEQAFSLGDQLFTQLVGTPALPAFELTSSGQGGMGLIFEFVIDDAAKFFQCVAQRIGRPGAGFAMALRDFKLQLRQHLLDRGLGLRFDLGIDLWLLRLGWRLNRHAAPEAQLIGPQRHWWQGCVGVVACCNRLAQCRLERIPNHQQLGA